MGVATSMPTFAIRLNATPDADPFVPATQLEEHGLTAIPEVPGLFEGEGFVPINRLSC